MTRRKCYHIELTKPNGEHEDASFEADQLHIQLLRVIAMLEKGDVLTMTIHDDLDEAMNTPNPKVVESDDG